MCIEILMLAESSKHQSLLDPSLLREPFVVSDRPTIAVDLILFNTCTSHISAQKLICSTRTRTNSFGQLLNLLIVPNNPFARNELLDRDLRLHAFGKLGDRFDRPFLVVECEDDIVVHSVDNIQELSNRSASAKEVEPSHARRLPLSEQYAVHLYFLVPHLASMGSLDTSAHPSWVVEANNK